MKNKKIIAMIITIVLLLSIILHFCNCLIHLNHNCTHDDNCPICQIIHKYRKNLNGIDTNLAKIVVANLLIFSLIVIYLNNIIRDKKKNTLIGLKVELLN